MLQSLSNRRDVAVQLATAIREASERNDSDGFGRAMVRWLGSQVKFDHCVVFGYRDSTRPPLLFETFSPAESHIFVTLYQEGPYLLDPFHHTAIDGREGFGRMRELAPDRFYASEYYRSYYSQTQLAEEVGFFIPLANRASAVLSLMRLQRSGVFGTAEIRLLRDVAAIVIALCRQRWQGEPIGEALRSPDPGPSGSEFDRARIWERLALTPREGEVVDLILQGHSADSIARILAISPGTAKVHRRNIYRKLAINSQAGLFACFISMVELQRA